jgi:hypothetical protein
MLDLGQEVQGVWKRAVFSGEFKSFLICRYATESIEKITQLSVGKIKAKKYCQQTKTLEIEMEGVSIGQVIRRQEERIIEDVNKRIGACCLRKIRYRLFS